MKSIFMVIVVLLLSCNACFLAFASNPADPTSDFRYSGDFLKLAWDDGPWYFLGIKEVGDRTSVLVFHWENKEGNCVLNEYGITKRFNAKGILELGLFVDDWNIDPNRMGAMVDWTNGRIGVGAILPTTDHPAKGEVRYNVGDITLNLAIAEADYPTANYGIGLNSGGIRYELAYGKNDEVWHFRACKPYGKFFPELRTQFNKNETLIGFAIGFCPE